VDHGEGKSGELEIGVSKTGVYLPLVGGVWGWGGGRGVGWLGVVWGRGVCCGCRERPGQSAQLSVRNSSVEYAPSGRIRRKKTGEGRGNKKKEDSRQREVGRGSNTARDGLKAPDIATGKTLA